MDEQNQDKNQSEQLEEEKQQQEVKKQAERLNRIAMKAATKAIKQAMIAVWNAIIAAISAIGPIILAVILIIVIIIVLIAGFKWLTDRQTIAEAAEIMQEDLSNYVSVEKNEEGQNEFVIKDELYEKIYDNLIATGIDPNTIGLDKDSKYLKAIVKAELATTYPMLSNENTDLSSDSFQGIVQIIRRAYNADDEDRYTDSDASVDKEILLEYISPGEFEEKYDELRGKGSFDSNKYKELAKYYTIEYTSANTINSASGTVYPGTKYNLTEDEKKTLATVVKGEYGDDINGMRAVASQMCNLYEYRRWSKGISSSQTLTGYVRNGGWYASSSFKRGYNEMSLQAVEECIINGNRTLPLYIDEFDLFPGDIVSPLSDSQYVQGVTKVRNRYGSKGTFWTITRGASGDANLFFYTSEAYKSYCNSFSANTETANVADNSETTSAQNEQKNEEKKVLTIKIAMYNGSEVEIQTISYQPKISQYAVPAEFLIAQLQASNNLDYVYNLADMMVNNSKMELILQEEYSQTTVDTYKEYDIVTYKEYRDTNNNLTGVTASTTHKDPYIEDTDVTTVISLKNYLREIDTWIVNVTQNFMKSNNVSTTQSEKENLGDGAYDPSSKTQIRNIQEYSETTIHTITYTQTPSSTGTAGAGTAVDGDGYTQEYIRNGRKYREYKQSRGSYKNKDYSEGKISNSGCGPTAVAIVASGYVDGYDPGNIGDIMGGGNNGGTNGEKMKSAFSNVGINSKVININSKDTILNELKQGKTMVISVNNKLNSLLAVNTHIIALLDVNDSDEVYVSNPNPNKATGWMSIDKVFSCSDGRYAVVVEDTSAGTNPVTNEQEGENQTEETQQESTQVEENATNTTSVIQKTGARIVSNEDKFLGLWKNSYGYYIPYYKEDGTIDNDAVYDEDGMKVKHGTGYPVDNIISAPEWFFNLLSVSERTQNHEQFMRYLMYKYTGQDFGVDKLDLSLFELSEFNSMGYDGNLYGNTTEEKIWNFLIMKGATKEGAAGMMGNMAWESGFDPTEVNSIGATGLCQWLRGRCTNLKEFAKNKGKNWDDLQVQLEFCWHELETVRSYKKTYIAMTTGNDVDAVTKVVFDNYEIPLDSTLPKRQQLARECYEKYKDIVVSMGRAPSSMTNNINIYNDDGTVNQQGIQQLSDYLTKELLNTTIHKGGVNQSGPFAKWWTQPINTLSKFQCTWWAYGRASQYLEVTGNTKYKQYPRRSDGRSGNGGEWYDFNKNAGWFNYGSTPKANSIISWKHPGYAGHVAYVEAVDSTGVWISHAGSGTSWRGIQKINANGNIGWSGYILNGFIYLDEPK